MMPHRREEPEIRTAREAANRELARNNLKQLEMALRNYRADLTAHELNEEDEEATDAEEKTATDRTNVFASLKIMGSCGNSAMERNPGGRSSTSMERIVGYATATGNA